MIYPLDIKVYCNDQSTLDAVIAAIPDVSDPRVREEEYEEPVQYRDDVTDHQLLTASIKFNNPADRLAVENDILEVQGLLNECEIGTGIKRRNSDHDAAVFTGCVYTVIYEVV